MLVAILLFIGLLLLKVPIAFVLGIGTVAYILVSGDIGLLETAPQRIYSGLENYGLLAIPLFMLAGELMNSGGITRRLVDFSKSLLGHFKGGLAYVNVIANMLLASIIGSATAQIAMMSKTMVPEMEKAGYSREFSAATTASAGLLGPIIPPSMLFIIYGVSSGTSIGDMFLAGIIPGIIFTISFIILIGWIGRKETWPTEERLSIKEILGAFVKAMPALAVPVIIILGIITGAFTPTESAAIASVVALFVGFFVYKELKIKNLPSILTNTVVTTAIITMLISMANLFGWMLSFEMIPQTLATWMVTLTENPLVFLLIINVFLLLIGMFLDGIAGLIILVPILTPIVAHYGIDPIHFGVIISVNLTLGLLTPPIGTGLYIASSLGGVKVEKLVKALIPFLIIAFLVLLIITYVPKITLWLPSIF